ILKSLMPSSYLKYLFILLYCCFFIKFGEVQAQEFPKGLATPICTDQVIPSNVPENSGYDEIYPCGMFTDPPGLSPLIPSDPLSPYIDFYYVVIQSEGTFTFVVTPNEEVNYDFGAFKNPNWEN